MHAIQFTVGTFTSRRTFLAPEMSLGLKSNALHSSLTFKMTNYDHVDKVVEDLELNRESSQEPGLSRLKDQSLRAPETTRLHRDLSTATPPRIIGA